jgi:long-subunit acyl-CoA synthetase (AMP-forming)
VLLNEILNRLQHKTTSLTFLSDSGLETVNSFDDLHRDTTALVAYLKQIGVVQGGRIGILAPNSYVWMVWDLAVMTLGCVSVALPQEKPSESIDVIVDRHLLQIFAVDPAWVAEDVMAREYVIGIQDFSFSSDKKALVQPAITHAPGTHSLVFSSGTTGKTKGLIIAAPGTERLLNLYAAAFGVAGPNGEQDRLLTFLPFANYQQRMAYYLCLYHGMEFVYVPFPRMFFGLKKYSPTYIIAPPIFYEAMQNMASAVVKPKPVVDGAPAVDTTVNAITTRLSELLGGNIRYMITGMAPIKRQTLDFYWEHKISLFEAFGITEAGMVAWNRPGQVRLGTVGKPAEPGSVTLSDEGEVIVTRDALLSLGYFESSEEDARNTFIAANSVATGDIAQFDADGFLTIIGRKKDAIITKAGEKFHPESVEALIQREPEIKLAVVLGGDNIPGITAIVVIADAANTALTDKIKLQISQINVDLPAFQQVKRVMFTGNDFTIDNGLRTKNMKLNRKAISAAFQDHASHNIALMSGKNK